MLSFPRAANHALCGGWSAAATLGTNTSLAGSILALTSISLATGANLDGRALARNGAVTLDQNTITLPICVLAVPGITTQIHDNVTNVDVTMTTVPTGTVVHDMATVTGTPGLPIPTGVVIFTVFANQNCSGVGTSAGTVPLDAAGIADPSSTATVTSAGLSYRAYYNGDATYNAAVGPCEILTAYPTAVELLYFRADRLIGQQVQLKWATALEMDNFGFNLYRANVNDLGLASLIHFEPAVTQGSGSGATYVYIDTDPYDGPSWYWLADVDTKGRETFHASINAPELSYMYPVFLPLVNRE